MVSPRRLNSSHSDNLSHTLPKAYSRGQEIAAMAVQTLKSLRSAFNFNLFGGKKCIADTLDVCTPNLQRCRKMGDLCV